MSKLSNIKFILPVLIVILTSCFSAQLFATAEYDYGADEYITIAKGLSPDGSFAITAHKDYGVDNFHLYLTNARTGRRIATLQEVDPTLDTAAFAFGAIWSDESSSVTLVWRWSRHNSLKSMTYKISQNGALPITKKSIDLDIDSKLVDFWSKNCSGESPTEKRFGTPKNKPEN
ncbi:hypothetical protein JIN85_17555 [Luteolibacter pohnpeiensis]|uniref:Uncharacterized protein n=1 Tax=Luteolibacter pohnpeiensis TaxID=454153 RepID=A0A934S6Z4_9BACT|nr:hypothetical protein [Luteolibacter pohnpeiensis]MBK1884230.1 hypothetical protein [Luteolibacter pohnpeiensis]